MLLCVLAACAAAQPQPEPQLALAGRTMDAKGQTLRKVSLSLRPLAANAAGESPAPYGVTSDKEGLFEFYGVRPGRYRLMAERAGYRRTFYGARNPWAPGAILTVRAGAPLTGVTVRLVEQAVLAGKVVTDEPAISWVVQLYRQQYQNGKRSWVCIDARSTGPGGEFSFNRLASGRYRLGATSAFFGVVEEEDLTYAATYYPGVPDPASAETIELRPGQTLSDIRLPRIKGTKATGSLSGSIVRKSGSSSVRPEVYLAPVGSDWAGSVSVTRDRFQRDSLKPGAYIVGVVFRSVGETRLLAWQTVQVSGTVEAPAFDLDSIGLRGTVKLERPAPSGAKLRIKLMPWEDPTPYFAAADVTEDGVFAIPGSFAGPFRIEVEGLPAGAYVKSALYGDKDALGALDLSFRGDEKLAIVIAAGARISGAVRDEKGNPLDGVVTLIPDPPEPRKISLYRLAETDAGGRFQFDGLRPGKYRLYAWEEFEPGAEFDPEVTAPLHARAMAIEVAEGERKEVTVLRIAADEAGVVSH